LKQRLFRTREHWRNWLSENHDSQSQIWLVYYKKHTGKQSVTQAEGVEEALCFGWIDSIVKRIDDEKYMQKYTPRKDKSNWSATNKKRVEKLIKEGRMTPAGMKKVKTAKRDGSWDSLSDVEKATVPDDLKKALTKNVRAKKNFDKFAPYQKKQYLWWLQSARRAETREKRIREIVERARQNIKPGI
jgi:uncharacterized protein YdeI (YjbR/CyaY-like superfamily)